MSSMGITCAQPPYGAALDAEKGPRDGSRSASTVFFPRRRSASPSPTVVVVLPSPAGVGGNGGHENQLAVRTALHSADRQQGDFGLIPAVKLQILRAQAQTARDLFNRPGVTLCAISISVNHIHAFPSVDGGDRRLMAGKRSESRFRRSRARFLPRLLLIGAAVDVLIYMIVRSGKNCKGTAVFLEAGMCRTFLSGVCLAIRRPYSIMKTYWVNKEKPDERKKQRNAGAQSGFRERL